MVNDGKNDRPRQENIKKGKKSKSKNDSMSKESQKSMGLQNRLKISSSNNWTGKLPVALLHEMCQKKKWNKVEYEVKRIRDKGLLGIAILSYTDEKTKKILTIRMNDPTYSKTKQTGVLMPQETAIEAKHFAATLALYRVAFNTNLHMVLPPNHKKLWYELDDYRKLLLKNDPNSCNIIFDPEPFLTLVNTLKMKEKRSKDLKIQQEKQEKSQKMPILLTSLKFSNDKNIGFDSKNQEQLNSDSGHAIKFSSKMWEKATFIDLEEKSRKLIEDSLKSSINWNEKKYKGESNEGRILLQKRLLMLGFRESHIYEAMDYGDPLGFLLFNLPEDDLPSFFHKRQSDSKTRVELSKLPLNINNMIDKLMESGFSYDEVLIALEKSEYNEAEAAGFLVEHLIPYNKIEQDISSQDSQYIWDQELNSLNSIYGDMIQVLTSNSYTIDLADTPNLKLKIYKTSKYPISLPGIIISTFNKKYKLANYIKQSILKNLLRYIHEMHLLGDIMVFHLFEWLNQNLNTIIENPGRLLHDKFMINTIDSEKSTKKMCFSFNNKLKNNELLSDSEIESMKSNYGEKIKSLEYLTMLKERKKLPAWKKKDVIVNMVDKHDVILVTGDTGSGKSTQIVQFLLDDLIVKKPKYFKGKIICTQPRRISAIGLAERVSDELCTKCGDEVGYIIRGVNKTSRSTRIKFMTTGILVRILQSNKSFLNDTIVVVDEVHERSVDTDLIIILLKELLGKVPGMKIILMSATVRIDTFKLFFKNLEMCHIEGRTFPITDYYLDDVLKVLDFKIKREKFKPKQNLEEIDIENLYITPTADSKFFKSGQINYELLSQTTVYVHNQLSHKSNNGSIIIFLPGVGEIVRCCRSLKSLDEANDFIILPLHSALTPYDQKLVFGVYKGKRKIIVSTNIAETSITIDDCVATIDTGRVKITEYNSKDNTTRLVETFVSKAEAKQRRGRAGRVCEGYSFKLFSKKLYETEMMDSPVPEIHRISLESLYISIKSMGIKDVINFLNKGLEAPPIESLKKAERNLTALGLLSEDNLSLTGLGKTISLLPVMDSKHGKLLMYSIIFGCADIGVLIASILSINSLPFVIGHDNRDEIKQLLSQYKHRGDLLAVVEIIQQYLLITDSSTKKKFIKTNCLSYNKISDILSCRSQLYSILQDTGFLPLNYIPGSTSYVNRNSRNFKIMKYVLTGAFYPNIAKIQFPDLKFISTSSGTIEKNADAKILKYWIRNEEYIDKIFGHSTNNEDIKQTFPATRVYIHSSSILFSNNNFESSTSLSNDTTSTLRKSQNTTTKAPFIIFNSIYETDKVYLKYLTPTSTLALLLFGGPIEYDLSKATHYPGIILDSWLPIRTWCKNAVLLKELKHLLDQTIKNMLENPTSYDHDNQILESRSIIDLVEKIIAIE